MYTAKEIANWFIYRADQDVDENGGDYLSHLKLQKLLYFAQGCYSAMEGKPLFGEEIYCWSHGPVVASLYQEFKHYGDRGIEDYDDFNIDKHTEAILEEVYQVFGQYSAWGLRNITHEQDPWKNAKLNDKIPLSVITDYFKKNIVTE